LLKKMVLVMASMLSPQKAIHSLLGIAYVTAFYIGAVISLGFAYLILILVYRFIISIELGSANFQVYANVKLLPALGIIVTIQLTSFVVMRALISIRPGGLNIQPLRRGMIPEIDELLNEISYELEARRFDRIYIVPTVEAAVFETNAIPLLPIPIRRRHLILGWPLVTHLTRMQLKAVLAHELAHFDNNAMFFHRTVYALRTRVENSFNSLLWWNTQWRHRITKRSWDISGIVERGTWLLWRVATILYHFWCIEFWNYLKAATRKSSHTFELYCDSRSALKYGRNNIIRALLLAAALEMTIKQHWQDPNFGQNLYEGLRYHFIFEGWPQEHLIEAKENEASDTHPSYRQRIDNLNGQSYPFVYDNSQPIIRDYRHYLGLEEYLSQILAAIMEAKQAREEVQ
jgi:Zn-dependent protease with chaperone function